MTQQHVASEQQPATGQYTFSPLPEDPVMDMVIPPKGLTAFEMTAGQHLRVEDLRGKQPADLLCYRLDDLSERFWAAHTAKLNETIYVTKGHALYSDRARPMMTIVEDTCGVNDVICGSCSYDLDVVRYGQDRAKPGCMQNFLQAVRPWGLGWNDLAMCFNIFLRYPVEESGYVTINKEAPSVPGDYMDLRADMDLLIAISNCPQENNPCTGFNPTELRIAVWEGTS